MSISIDTITKELINAISLLSYTTYIALNKELCNRQFNIYAPDIAKIYRDLARKKIKIQVDKQIDIYKVRLVVTKKRSHSV